LPDTTADNKQVRAHTIPTNYSHTNAIVVIIRISIGDLIAGVGRQQRRLPRTVNTLAPPLLEKTFIIIIFDLVLQGLKISKYNTYVQNGYDSFHTAFTYYYIPVIIKSAT